MFQIKQEGIYSDERMKIYFLEKEKLLCCVSTLSIHRGKGKEEISFTTSPVCVCVCVYRGVKVQPMDHLESFEEFPAVEKAQVALGSRIMKAVLYSRGSEQSMCASYL